MSGRYVLLFLVFPVMLFASTYGSKSLWHVQMARTLNPGRLELRTDMNFYTKVGDYLGENKPANFSAVNWWDVQGNVLLTYGVVQKFDMSVLLRTYQDLNIWEEYNTPDDVILDVKTAGYQIINQNFNFGALLSVRFPVGKIRNYAFEEYASPGVTPELRFLFSYYKDPYLPDRDISWHLNLGYKNYFDSGKEIIDRENFVVKAGTYDEDGGNSSAFVYGTGLVFPTDLFDLNLELSGLYYLNKPDSAVFSRENFLYLTPGIRVKPYAWLSLNFGLDVRLSKDEDNSKFLTGVASRNLDLPNYPAWKFRMGMDVTLMPLVTYTKSKVEVEKQELGRRVEFFEEIIRERKKAEKIEEELQRLRRQREEAEKELEELRQLLEETGPKE